LKKKIGSALRSEHITKIGNRLGTYFPKNTKVNTAKKVQVPVQDRFFSIIFSTPVQLKTDFKKQEIK
jgi:hypothetical protein